MASGGKRTKITELEAYQRCPDMVLGQNWIGSKGKYRFNCEHHGVYSKTWRDRVAGWGCKSCSREKQFQKWDLTGRRFGFRTVIAFAGHKPEYGNAFLWLCRCNCGSEDVVAGGALRSGTAHMCQHCSNSALHKRNLLPDDLAAFRHVWRATKNSARYRKLDWDLSEDFFRKLTQRDCVYCGNHPSNQAKPYRGLWVYNGADRVDNTRGYLMDNVVACCWVCNRMKREMSVDQFISHVKKIVEWSERQHAC